MTARCFTHNAWTALSTSGRTSGGSTSSGSATPRQGASAWMEQPTACRPTRRRSSRQPASTSGIWDRHARPSRTAHRRRRAARLRQIGGGQPSRRPIAGGPQSSRASLDRSGAARLARLIAGTSRQSPALLRRDLRPAKPPWAFDHRALRASWRSTIRPSRPKRSQSGLRVRRSAAGLFDQIQRRRSHEIRLLGGCLLRMDKLAKMRSRPSGCRRVKRVASDRHPRAIPARHRRTGDDRGCQRRPRNMAQPGDFQKLADQRLFQNSAPRFLHQGAWGSRGPGFKSRQPDQMRLTPFGGPLGLDPIRWTAVMTMRPGGCGLSVDPRIRSGSGNRGRYGAGLCCRSSRCSRPCRRLVGGLCAIFVD